MGRRVTEFWVFITDLGDSAVTLTLAAAVLAWLGLATRARSAFWTWGGGIAACGLTMAALKVLFRSCGHGWIDQVASPSGHAAMSAVVYGGLVLLAGRGAGRVPQALLLLAVLVLVAVIGVSRVELNAHSLSEVLIGLGVGTGVTMLMQRRLADGPPVAGAGWALGGAVVLAVLLHGVHWHVEDQFQALAAWIRGVAPACR